MGVGYDRIDRAAAAARGVMVCNVPDYGTTEVADHAIALALALRRGVLLHHEAQRRTPPAAWAPIDTPLVRRLDVQTFGIVGLGRIGTAVALRARAFGFRVVFFDPYRPNGAERALGIERARTLEELLRQTRRAVAARAADARDARHDRGARTGAAAATARWWSTRRAGRSSISTRWPTALRSGHIAGAGLDVLPVEPPVEPVPELLRAYRAREDWLEGRLVITPHSAFHSPQAWDDIRRKSAETMAAALLDQPAAERDRAGRSVTAGARYDGVCPGAIRAAAAGRRAPRRSSKRCSTTKNDGTNSTARQVEAIMPLNTASPSEMRAVAPAPRGEHQRHDAEDEGERRHHDRPEPRLAPRRRPRRGSARPRRAALARDLDDQDGVLGRQRDQQHEADLGVEIVGEAERAAAAAPARAATAAPRG